MRRGRRITPDDLGPAAREQAQRTVDQVPTEEDEQRALIAWADEAMFRVPLGREPEHGEVVACPVGCYLVAIPNGGARHKAEGGKLKAQGVRAGFPDLLLALPANGFHGLLIELKRQKGGSVSDAQRQWHTRLAAAGYAVAVARGWREAVREIQAYLYPALGDPDDE